MCFEPNFKNIIEVSLNRKPDRLPIYEHVISPLIMEKVLDIKFADLIDGDLGDIDEYFKNYCYFFKEMTYDTVSYEICVTTILPEGGALFGGKGPIQNRDDFDKYPWDSLKDIYWKYAEKRFDSLVRQLPDGMKIVGGVGNGVFEISEDLVGLESLAYMQIDDPTLFSDLYIKIGDMLCDIWAKLLDRYSEYFALCRFGDDLGFKGGTLISPLTIKYHIIPQYGKIVNLIKSYNKPFLLHSCGNIFNVMDDIISIGVNAKHSNEDVISPFEKWIDLYGSKIGLFGGIDVDLLCREKPDGIKEKVFDTGKHFREIAKGYALGSGNSIPDYVPVAGYLAMIEAVKKIREFERS